MVPPLLAVVALCAATVTSTLQVGEHAFQRRTLANGLEAIAVDDGAAGTISVFVVYAAGSRDETEATTGLAHLVEHSMFTGTAKTPAGQHDAAVQALGGESDAYTRDDFTVYYDHKVPPEALARILALEADRMRGLTWDEAAFLRERERLRVEEAGGNRPEVQLEARRDQAVWRGRGYGAGVLDAAGNTRGPTLTLAQARAFYDAWYHPRNAAVVVVGGAPGAALDAIEAAFAALPTGPARPRLELDPPADRPMTLALDAPLTRDRLEWAWVGPPIAASPLDRVALDLLAELLDGRLGADGSPVDASAPGRDGRDLFVLGGTGPGAPAALQTAWDDLRAARFTDEALAAARGRLLARLAERPLGSRRYFSLAVEVAVEVALGEGEFAASEPALVELVSRADLEDVARRWLPPGARTTLAWHGTATVAPLPDAADALRAAAEAAEGSGDLERAIAAYEKLITLGPGRIDLVIFRYELGALNRRLGRLEEARRQLLAGLAVVEYPAVRELLDEVEAELRAKGWTPPPAEAPPPAGPGALPPGHPPLPPGHPPLPPGHPPLPPGHPPLPPGHPPLPPGHPPDAPF